MKNCDPYSNIFSTLFGRENPIITYRRIVEQSSRINMHRVFFSKKISRIKKNCNVERLNNGEYFLEKKKELQRLPEPEDICGTNNTR